MDVREFLNGNNLKFRLLRTIFEGIVSVLLVNAAIIVAWANMPPEVASIITALVVAVLSPVLNVLRKGYPEADEEAENAR